jgi:hypothetical protein
MAIRRQSSHSHIRDSEGPRASDWSSQQRYFCFEVIAFRFVEKGQILFVLSRNPHTAIVAVENHAGDSFPEDHVKRPVIGRNLIFNKTPGRPVRDPSDFSIR